MGKTSTRELEERLERCLSAPALLANPFDHLEPGLAHMTPGHTARDQAYAQLEDALRLHQARGASKKSWSRAARWAWALMIYPGLIDAIDAHIATPPSPGQELSWAKEAFAQLRQGLDRQESAWWLSLFYQWRRAWRLLHEQLPGAGPSMTQLRATVWACCFGPSLEAYERGLWSKLHHLGVWVAGEPGAGHEHLASCLAGSAWRGYDERAACFEGDDTAAHALITIDLEGLNHLEQEALLFGHRKGALLPRSSVGALERAGLGQLILIEGIEHTTTALQLALARAQQRRQFTPAGADTALPLHVRLILSIKRPGAALIDDGELEPAAYYKLGACSVRLPPLRRHLREADQPLQALAQHIALALSSSGRHDDPDQLAQTITAHIGPGYTWPGNLHELAHAITQVELLGRYQPEGEGSPVDQVAGNAELLAAALTSGEISIKELTERYCRMLYEQLGTYEAVAARTGLDRRTVKKYIHP